MKELWNSLSDACLQLLVSCLTEKHFVWGKRRRLLEFGVYKEGKSPRDAMIPPELFSKNTTVVKHYCGKTLLWWKMVLGGKHYRSSVVRVTEERIVRGVCFCCGGHESSQWYRVPWDRSSENRACNTCYSMFRHNGVRCYKCNRVYNKARAIKKSREEELASLTLPSGEVVHGFSCDYCDGVINKYEGEQNSPGYIKETGVCFICGCERICEWRKIPWKPGSQWCSVCRSRYGGTATICTNEECLKIPLAEELNRMEVIDAEKGWYKCLDCGHTAKKNLSQKCRTKKTSESTFGKCFACGPKTSLRWDSMQWDGTQRVQVCHSCYLLYREHNGRCLNLGCRKIFRRKEIDDMMNQTIISGVEGKQSYPCIECGGMTTVF